MELPYELKILPPQAHDVLRFLNGQSGGQADAIAICRGAELSDRAFGKAIRRLVTRNYLSMDMSGSYRLTPEGRKAAKLIAEIGGVQQAEDGDEETITAPRRLTVVVPKVLPTGKPAELYAGIDAPGAARLKASTSVVLRLEGVNCDVSPPEYTVKVPPDTAAEPVTFVVTSAQTGKSRVRVRAYQLVRADEVEEVGGMYFDVTSDDKNSADLKALGIDLDLHL